MEKQYRSEIAEVLHQDMKAMYKVGAVTTAELRKFEKDCFVSESTGEDKKQYPKTAKIIPSLAHA
jgi:DNA-binding transcriptional regulator YiaG